MIALHKSNIITKIIASVSMLAMCLLLILGFSSCSSSSSAEKGSQSNPIKIGVVGAADEQWSVFVSAAKAEGIYVDIKDFTEYTQPNPALSEGQLDLNEFQHILFLAKYNADNNKNLTPIGATAVFPISLYGSSSKDIKSLNDLKSGDKVAIPNDGTNQSRAIFMLSNAGLVKLNDTHGVILTPADINTAESIVIVYPVSADLTATTLSDPQIKGSVVNNDFVKNLPELDAKNILFTEDADSEGAKPYINVFVSKNEDKNNETYLKLVKIFNNNVDVQKALASSAGGEDKLIPVGNKYSIDELSEILNSQITAYNTSK